MTSNNLVGITEARQILYKIISLFPDAKGELKWGTPFQLLCAVLMSAQTTDKMVNKVTPILFEKFPNPKSLAAANISDIEACIRNIGLYRTKAKHLKATATLIENKYQGIVPKNKKALLTLPGVGIKTANVVLAEAFGVPSIAVDTHVMRIAKQFKIVPKSAEPSQIETILENIMPQKDWIKLHHAMIAFGRYKMPAKYRNENPYDFLK